MRRLSISDAARRDLAAIAEVSRSEWGRQQSRRYLAALRRLLMRLRRHPMLGVAREELAAGLRSAPVGRHVVIYRGLDEEILIVRVLHDRMDVHRHIGDRE